MKQMIRANTWPAGFSELEVLAHDAGYQLDLKDDGTLTISTIHSNEVDMLPSIKAIKCNEFPTSSYSGYYYNVEVSYPKFYSKSATYADDMEYQVSKFAAAAKFVSTLLRWHS